MKRAVLLVGVISLAGGLLVWGGAAAPAPARQTSAERRAASKPAVLAAYGKLPLVFEANQGQTDEQVKFLSRGPGYTLFLTSTEAVLSLRSPQSRPRSKNELAGSSPTSFASSASSAVRLPKGRPETTVLRMQLVGANPEPEVVGLKELPGRSNYFLGNDPSKWRTNIPHYARVRYEEVYPGIDLVYYGTNQQQLEYDFVVAPGADPGVIRLAIDGPDKLEVTAHGDLLLHIAGGKVRLQTPVVYQEVDGIRRKITGGYVLQGKSQVGFQVAAYDASNFLVIDPVLSYSTYLGAPGSEEANGIAVDSSGNAYVTGRTLSLAFPTVNPFQPAHGGGSLDTFVSKIDVAGSALVYSTFLGGRFDEIGYAIAVDAAGNAYVTGFTNSDDFPTQNPLQPTILASDVFVTKLNAAGNGLIYSTYLGGSSFENTFFDFGFYTTMIAVDAAGNAYVTGATTSTDFPTANALQPAFGGVRDAFVTKINAAGSAFIYSTYLGGGGDDTAHGIAVDSVGNAYVTGTTSSLNFPLVNALQATPGGGPRDAFVTKINADGSALVYSTFLGGSDGENRTISLGSFISNGGIVVDSSGNAYVTGFTSSTDFPTSVGAFQTAKAGFGDAFVTKLNATGSALVYSTYLGGAGSDGGARIAVDAAGNAYVIAPTNSFNFPTANAFQSAFGGGEADVYVTKIDATGTALVYSTYLGGSLFDGGNAIALDASGNAYVTG